MDLETQEFQLDLMQSFNLKKARRRSQTAMALSAVAQGSVMVDLVLKDERAQGEKAAQPFVRVSFVVYFQVCAAAAASSTLEEVSSPLGAQPHTPPTHPDGAPP